MKIARLLVLVLITVGLLAIWLVGPTPPTATGPISPELPSTAAPASTPSASPLAAPANPLATPANPPFAGEGWIDRHAAPASPIAGILARGSLRAESARPVSDAPGTLETVRILEVADLKYPLIRTETSSDSEEPDAVMVADHFIVKKAETLSEVEFREALRARGFGVRRQMLAPDTYVVSLPATDPDRLLARFDAAREELQAHGRPEPDYLVEAFLDPNDPFENQLWGLHNVGAHITITSGPGDGEEFIEGGKMAFGGEVPEGGFAGPLIDCGLGRPEDFPVGTSGYIALIDRGDFGFADKTANATAAGAVAVLMVNNVSGGFDGTLADLDDWVPVIPLSQEDGASLRSHLPCDVMLETMPNGRDISARAAWERSTGSGDVVVGVIDTGIDHQHPDLMANIWVNPGESGLDAEGADKASNGVDDDGNGFIDDVHGWDFANDDSDPMDDQRHGTHVAGTIGAVGDNATGVVGVAWDVSLAGIKFLDASGSGYTSDAIDSVYYSTLIGVDLTNNSWGGGSYSQALRDAVEDANQNGILFVAAAGNSASENPMYPAALDPSNIISVAATNSRDELASFSNYGLPHTDIAAPGELIFSTVPRFHDPDYDFLSGTSMASPQVAGAAALLRAAVPSMGMEDLRNHLLETGDLLPALNRKVVTSRRLNAAAALDGVREEPDLDLVAITISAESPAASEDGVINPGEVSRSL